MDKLKEKIALVMDIKRDVHCAGEKTHLPAKSRNRTNPGLNPLLCARRMQFVRSARGLAHVPLSSLQRARGTRHL
jgi:hypothetical protein